MKIFVLIAIVFLSHSCVKEEPGPGPVSPSGSDPKGHVTFKVTWDPKYPSGSNLNCVTAIIGLGYSSSDVANKSYFEKREILGGNTTSEFKNFGTGIYYYSAYTKFLSSTCGTGQGVPKEKFTSGSFKIENDKTTNVTVSIK